MELFVSTATSSRTTALSLSSVPRRPCPSVLPLRRHLPSRGLRCAHANFSEPVPSEEPASASTVVVTEKPDAAAEEKPKAATRASASATAAEEKDGGFGAVPSGSGSSVVAVAAPASSDGEGGEIDFLSKLDFELSPTYAIYGSGAFIALWILSAVVSAIDSVPLLPKALEIVGLGYSIWFSVRYLLFKENRDELFAKIDDLIGRII